jgi:predicted phage tail protein
MSTTWTSHNLKNGHTYYWYIRTINAFGASAFVEVARCARQIPVNSSTSLMILFGF